MDLEYQSWWKKGRCLGFGSPKRETSCLPVGGGFREFEEETVDGMVNIAIKLLLRVLHGGREG